MAFLGLYTGCFPKSPGEKPGGFSVASGLITHHSILFNPGKRKTYEGRDFKSAVKINTFAGQKQIMKIKAQIPNIITLLNLFCGCIALVFAFRLNFEYAFYFVSLGIFLDFFDGFFARLLKVQSDLGLQLDSLADMVTSGVVPGAAMFFLLAHSQNPGYGFFQPDFTGSLLPFLGFIITMGSCYRLANFNVDTRQTSSFIGLPTPANALFILSLPLIVAYNEYPVVTAALSNQWVLLFITALSAYILNAEIPLFALKIKSFDLKSNLLQIVFILISLGLIIAFRFLGIPLLIIVYILMSVINNATQKD